MVIGLWHSWGLNDGRNSTILEMFSVSVVCWEEGIPLLLIPSPVVGEYQWHRGGGQGSLTEGHQRGSLEQ